VRVPVLMGVLGLGLVGFALPLQAQEDPFGGLPEGEGRDLVFGTCTACHSTRIIVQQGMTRTAWDRTLTWMVEKQGMPEPPEETRAQILDYLAEHFPATRRGGRPGMSLMPLPMPMPLPGK